MKKTVLKVNINCMKCKKELMKTVNKLEGIDAVAVDSAKGTMTVIGIVDPVAVANRLRKSGKVVEVISVGPNKNEDKPKKPICVPNFPSCCKQCELVGIGFPYYYQGHDCSIL